MTPSEILDAVRSIGLELTVVGDRLRLSPGLLAPSPELRQAIRDNRDAIIQYLSVPKTVEPFPAVPGAGAPVKCNQCRYTDDDGHGDPVCGFLLCRLGLPARWGNKLAPCGRFEPKGDAP